MGWEGPNVKPAEEPVSLVLVTQIAATPPSAGLEWKGTVHIR